MSGAVVRGLRVRARTAVHRPDGPCACAEAGRVLAERDDGVVVRHGAVVAKAHAGETDPDGLAARLAVAAHPLLADVLLPPLGRAQAALPDGRPVSLWPYGTPVDPRTPDRAPWVEAGELLARLHRVDVARLPGPLPPMRGPAKAARAVRRMRSAVPSTPAARASAPAAAAVERAWLTLPRWARDETPAPRTDTLCHGDLHLGQLVRAPAPDGPWRLIDVDDLGVGPAVWDLARPAAWYACGLLGPAEWDRFLGAYRAAGGPAVPATGDPWPALDPAARALTVQTAALAVARARREGRGPDPDEWAVITACDRMGVPSAVE
ncbi:aminoglycoside phosphotransferase family protein [Streptomyces sp. NPDC049906]|uniref:aminoglycoside phosphotransferase family protein n=1 Tax=Streptomyces sp. NPDC049906 TaxID=3155656 RepID=UPI00343E1BC7